MKILLTGAAGFVGSHVLRHLLVNTSWEIICPVTFRHQGVPERIASALQGQDKSRVTVERHDLRAGVSFQARRRWGKVDVVMNVASESHVDRSIEDPAGFIDNNVQLMTGILEYAREAKPSLVLHMSTDEVYGPAYGEHRHREGEPHRPSNPYSASKAAQEAVAFSYWRTYGVPVVITNTMNIIGEMQDPEKFVPKIMKHAAEGIPMPIHVSPEGEPGTRFYLHARNLADAWLFLVRDHYGTHHEVPAYQDGFYDLDRWNIVGEKEIDNLSMAHFVAKTMGKDLLVDEVNFHSSRPGHDLRYALDGTKLADAGWKAPFPLDVSLEKTIRWTLEHPEWL